MKLTAYSVNHPFAAATAASVNAGTRMGAATGSLLGLVTWWLLKFSVWFIVAVVLGVAWAGYWTVRLGMVLARVVIARRSAGSQYPEGVVYRG